MSGVFISYRREDSAGHAGRLFDRLVSRFGPDQVFMDLDTIKPGEDFAKVIEDRIASCDVLLALIGRDWLDIADAMGQRRLNIAEDFVQLEIASALNRGLIVIPVLVEGARIPPPEALPPPLKRLSRLQALSLSDGRFAQDTEELIANIERYVVSPIVPSISGNPRRRHISVATAVLSGLGLLLGLFWVNKPRAPAGEVVNLSGRWVADVPTRDGQHYTITLELERVGDRILGRVDYPAGSGGLEEGRVENDRLSFKTVHRPQFSEQTAITRFEGQIIGKELELVMQYDDVVNRIRARRDMKRG